MRSFLKIILVATLFAGAALRIVVFFQNRSLFLDEANLARNIAERKGWEFFEPLSYQQFAPPLFSWLVKMSTMILGNTEIGLRLVPLLAGLASLYLFYRIATDLLPSFPAQWMAVWIFSFHGQLLRYATECKQYGADVFAALLFIYLALAQSRRPFGWKQALGWALFGAVMIWFSMPLVFVLSGVGIYLLFHFWKKKDKKALWGMGLAIAAWLLSFGLFFLLLLRPDAEGDYLQQYHQPYFLPLLPGSTAEWNQLGQLLLGLVGDFAGPTVVAQTIGIIGLLVACLPERQNERILWALPLLTCLLASGLHYYSLLSRLVLFLIPILLLGSAFGWGIIWGKMGRYGRLVALLLLIFMAGVHNSFRYFVKPYAISEIRPALEYVEASQQPGDRLFLYKWAVPAFDFYTRWHARPLHFLDKTPVLEEGPVEEERAWLVYTHLLSKETRGEMEADLRRFGETGALREAFNSRGTAVWLWSKKAQ